MCGIAGFTHFARKPSPGIIRNAVSSIRHRGPDQEGVFEAQHVSLGAVRLKIIDLQGGDQPMTFEDAGLVIAFNGEIYNHAELRVELESLGHRFETHCDTEVVLHAFAEWDVASFKRLRGMFAAAFWQKDEQRLVLARDRMGIKPLYYSLRRGELHFGSELKALFAHPDIPRRLCGEALGYYLMLNYVPSPYTLVEGIVKLGAGNWLEFRNGRATTGEYWQNEFRPQQVNQEDATQQLDDLLRDSIREHLVSDVPLGVWASGGLDSSAILHYAAQLTNQKLKTFSISFAGRRFDESKFFRALADHYQTEHYEFDLNTDLDLTGAIQELAYYSDEPSADAGALPVYFLSRMCRQHVTVALSGEGADEIFGGYQTYLADRYAQRTRIVPRALLGAGLRLAGLLPVSDEKIGFEYKLKRFLSGTLLPADDAHFFWNGTFTAGELQTAEFPTTLNSPASLVAALSNVPASDVVNRYLFVDQHYYLADDILYKCDRMSMAHSLEVRPPFLDHRIVEFAATLPSNLKIRGDKTKYLMRELLKTKLPALILDRKKEGLDIPAHEWLRGPLKPLVDETLSNESVEAAGVLQPEFVQNLIRRHNAREANLGYHLWGLLTLHLWMKRWNIEPIQSSERSMDDAVAHVVQ